MVRLSAARHGVPAGRWALPLRQFAFVVAAALAVAVLYGVGSAALASRVQAELPVEASGPDSLPTKAWLAGSWTLASMPSEGSGAKPTQISLRLEEGGSFSMGASGSAATQSGTWILTGSANGWAEVLLDEDDLDADPSDDRSLQVEIKSADGGRGALFTIEPYRIEDITMSRVDGPGEAAKAWMIGGWRMDIQPPAGSGEQSQSIAMAFKENGELSIGEDGESSKSGWWLATSADSDRISLLLNLDPVVPSWAFLDVRKAGADGARGILRWRKDASPVDVAAQVTMSRTARADLESTAGPMNPAQQDDANADERLVRIHNRWQADQFLNIENGTIISGPIRSQWWSAQWTIEASEEGFIRIRNRGKPDHYLHIEHGTVEAGPIESAWWSAQWTLEGADDGFVRIRNRWKPQRYLHIEYGSVQAGPIEPEWWSAMWTIELAVAP
jgi:hypothetical protein